MECGGCDPAAGVGNGEYFGGPCARGYRLGLPHIPSAGERGYFTTNQFVANWRALNRFIRTKCVGELPIVAEWNARIMEHRWRKRFDGPYVPLLIDPVSGGGTGDEEGCRGADRVEAGDFREGDVIDLLCSEDEPEFARQMARVF